MDFAGQCECTMCNDDNEGQCGSDADVYVDNQMLCHFCLDMCQVEHVSNNEIG